TRNGDTVSIIPRDGLRARFHVVRNDQRLHMELTGDGFAKEQPIAVNDALSKIAFTLENRAKAAHQGQLELNGLPAGKYTLTIDGKTVPITIADGKPSQPIALPVGGAVTAVVVIERVN